MEWTFWSNAALNIPITVKPADRDEGKSLRKISGLESTLLRSGHFSSSGEFAHAESVQLSLSRYGLLSLEMREGNTSPDNGTFPGRLWATMATILGSSASHIGLSIGNNWTATLSLGATSSE